MPLDIGVFIGYSFAHHEKAPDHEEVVLTTTDIVRSLALRETAGPEHAGNFGTAPAQQAGPAKKRAGFRVLPPAQRNRARIRVTIKRSRATGVSTP